MTHRTLLLLAGTAALATAIPVTAQDIPYPQPDHGEVSHHEGPGHHRGYDDRAGQYDGAWEGEWADEDVWHGQWTGSYTDADGRRTEADYRGMWMGEQSFASEDGRMRAHDGHGWRERRGQRRHRGPRLGYSPQERAQWLSDCRYLMAGRGGYHDDGGDGGLVGGVLGAVIGGVAGNRIADGNRVLGTVVGAGLGGLAGAAIGSAIDGDGDGEISRDELWAAHYCDAYLRRYEMGAGSWGAAQPAMMVPVRSAPPRRHYRQRHCGACAQVEVVEEIVTLEEPAPRPAPPVAPVPLPEPQGKLTPIE